jgi:hypothetical protein
MKTVRWLVPAALLTLLGGARADEAEALEVLEKAGGRPVRDDKRPGRPVVELSFRNSLRLRDAHLKEVAKLPALRSLDLHNTPVTGSGLASLQGLKSLETLVLSGTQVSGDRLRHLLDL